MSSEGTIIGPFNPANCDPRVLKYLDKYDLPSEFAQQIKWRGDFYLLTDRDIQKVGAQIFISSNQKNETSIIIYLGDEDDKNKRLIKINILPEGLELDYFVERVWFSVYTFSNPQIPSKLEVTNKNYTGVEAEQGEKLVVEANRIARESLKNEMRELSWHVRNHLESVSNIRENPGRIVTDYLFDTSSSETDSTSTETTSS